MQILRSIVKSGLLLTPEQTSWQEPVSGGGLSKPIRVIQKRACFTELAPTELKRHSEDFGRFALEFKIQGLRQLGAIPAFYFPRASTDDIGMESSAASLLCRTGEIQTLLNRLGDLEDLIKATKNKSAILNLKNNVTGKQKPTHMTISDAQDFLSFLTHGNQSASILRNALRVLCSFFYPAEDLNHTDVMGYYRQREWRIVANMSKLGKEQTRPLSEEEVEHLLHLDVEFFGEEEEYFTGLHRRVDQCKYFDVLEGKNFIHYVRRVIVPREALHEAAVILEGDGMPIVTTKPTPPMWRRVLGC